MEVNTEIMNMKTKKTGRKTLPGLFNGKIVPLIFLLITMQFFNEKTNAQVLGVFQFTGTQNSGCPTGTVASQPANASFGTGNAFTSANVNCSSGGAADTYRSSGWNTGGTIDLTEYHQFTITPNAGYTLTLTNFSFFNQVTDQMNWFVRSSVNNFATNIGSGTATTTAQTSSFALPGSYTGLGATTFRIYITNSGGSTDVLRIDNVQLNGTVVLTCVPPSAPTVSSPVEYCLNATPAVLTASGSNKLWYTTPTGGTGSSTAPTPVTTAPGTFPFYVSQSVVVGCESARSTINVIVHGLPVASVDDQSDVNCYAGTDGTITVKALGGTLPVSYSFSVNNGTNWQAANIGGDKSKFSTLIANTAYRIRVKDNNTGCLSK